MCKCRNDQHISANNSKATPVLNVMNSRTASKVLILEGDMVNRGFGSGHRMSGINTGGFIAVLDKDTVIALFDQANPDAGVECWWSAGRYWNYGSGIEAKLFRQKAFA